MARDLGQHLAVTNSTLAKQLYERNLLRSTELRTRQTYQVRRTIAGSRVSVLHLATTALDPPGGRGAPTRPTKHPTTSGPAATLTEAPTGRAGQVTPPPNPPPAPAHDTPDPSPGARPPQPARPGPTNPPTQGHLPMADRGPGAPEPDAG